MAVPEIEPPPPFQQVAGCCVWGTSAPLPACLFYTLPFTKSASLGERLGDLGPERLIYLQGLRVVRVSHCLLVSYRIISLMIRQVMSPSSKTLPDTVPTSPLLGARPIHDRSISQLAFIVLGLFTILQWLICQLDWSIDTEFVNDLYQFTGTHTCRHTSLSLTRLAQFTASFFLATCYRFNVAAACINATIIIMIVVAILEQVPTSVLRDLRGKRVPAHAGAQQLAGGSGESHPTSKQTEKNACLPFLLLLLPFSTTLTYTHQCRQPPQTKILLYRGFLEAASERKNGHRTVRRHRWAKRAHLYPLFALLLLTCPAQ